MNLRPVIRFEVRLVAHFLAAGMLNTAFGYGIFALCIAAGAIPPRAVIVSTIAGVCFNFRTLGAVFSAQGLARLPQFAAVYAVLALVNIALLRLAGYAGTGPYLGEALALAVVIPLTYLAMRQLVFAPSTGPNQPA